MDTTTQKDARVFVDGIVSYMRSDTKSGQVLPKVASALQKVTAKTKKEKQATVTSSIALATSEKKAIALFLQKLLGHDVSVQTNVDQSLLGGFRIEVGDVVIDTSLSAQVDDMARSLSA